MKIDIKSREQMKSDIMITLNYFFPKGINELSIGNMWNVWFNTFESINYPDNNPNVIFVNGVRLFSQNPDYILYPCNSIDNTLQTALIAIFKELNISVLK